MTTYGVYTGLSRPNPEANLLMDQERRLQGGGKNYETRVHLFLFGSL